MKHLCLLVLVSSTPALSLELSYNYRSEMGRNTTGYNLNVSSLHFSAEVIDFNRPGILSAKQPDQFRAILSQKNNLGLFQAEVQGIRSSEDPEARNLFSFLRNRYALLENDFFKVSLQSQLYALKDDQRLSIGLPLELSLGKKNFAGVSVLLEDGRYALRRMKKEVLTSYYSYRFLQDYTANVALYRELIHAPGYKPLTQLSAGLQYQGRGPLRLMIGTSTSRFQREVIWNHTAGATITF